MKRSRWKAGLTVAAVAGVVGVAPATAQEGPAAVPRSEYEQLRAELEAMRRRLEGLEANLPDEQAITQYRQFVEDHAKRDADRRGNGDGLMFDTSRFKPGWERARTPGWMELGKLEQMNVQIGRAGPLDLYMGLNTAGRLQYLVQDNVEIGGQEEPSLDPGFQTAWGSVDFLADVYDGALEVYFDLYLSSKPHQSEMQGNEGYMLMRRIPGTEDTLVGNFFEAVNIKAGQFEIDFGDHRYRRSDNARVQRNPLVGNYIMDPKTTEIGMEVFNATPGKFNWLAGFGSGSETGGFDSGRGVSVHGKLWSNLGNLRLAGSAYFVNHDPDSGARSNLFRASRSGGVYGGVLDDGNAPGQVLVGTGQDVLAFQGDVSWIADPIELYGHLGWVRDDAVGGGQEEWIYYTAEGVYRFNPRLYAAARYSGALAQELQGVSSDGQIHRIQIGGGYWLYSTVLVKVEYVHQIYSDFDPSGGQVSGVDAWLDPSFNGVITEVSFAF